MKTRSTTPDTFGPDSLGLELSEDVKCFSVIDAHAGGNPTRIVLSGLPDLGAGTVAERAERLAAQHDWIRSCLVNEPRGGALTSAAAIVPPSDPRADLGVIFLEPHGYPPMCGSDTISVTTLCGHLGIELTAPTTTIRLETPAGIVGSTAYVNERGTVDSVTFSNVPAHVTELDYPIETTAHGTVAADLAYGGNHYAIVDARSLGLSLASSDMHIAVAVAEDLFAGLRQQGNLDTDHVLFFDAYEDGIDADLLVVIPPRTADRSPCGTGTTARIAALAARGLLDVGETCTHRSFTGERFTGRLREVTQSTVTEYQVEISGTAHLIGAGVVLASARDPLRKGFPSV